LSEVAFTPRESDIFLGLLEWMHDHPAAARALSEALVGAGRGSLDEGRGADSYFAAQDGVRAAHPAAWHALCDVFVRARGRPDAP